MDIRGKFNCSFSVSSISASSVTGRSYIRTDVNCKGLYHPDIFTGKDDSSHLDMGTFEVLELNWLYCERSVSIGKGDRIEINSDEYSLTDTVFEVVTLQPCGRFFYEMFIKRLGRN